MRIVRVILKEQDDLFAEVIRICNHPYILDDYYVYIQLEPDLKKELLTKWMRPFRSAIAATATNAPFQQFSHLLPSGFLRRLISSLF